MAIILKAFRDVQAEDHDIDFSDLLLRESLVFGFSQDSGEHLDCGKSGDQDGGSTGPLGHVPHKPKYRPFTKISVNRALQPIDYSDDHRDTSITRA